MTTDNKTKPALAQLVHHQEDEERHLMDYVRVIYKRRWVALPAFLIVFTIGAINSFRTTPIYEAHTQLLIEKDTPKVGNLQTMFQESDGWYNDDFYQTQIRILQSRSLARQTAQLMKLPQRPMAAPEGGGPINITGALWGTAGWVKHQIAGDPPKPPVRTSTEPPDPLAPYVGMVLGSISVSPVR